MKIALTVYQFIVEKGGVERYVFDLSKQLLDRGYEIHIFAHRFSRDRDKRLILHHVPAITCWSPLKHWTFAVNAPKVIKKSGIKFDLVHGFTQTLFQDIYQVGGGCHWEYMMHTYPLMQSLFGKIIMCLNPRHSSLLLLEKLIFQGKRYKQIVCVSEQCKKELLHHYKLLAANIEVIYNGVDTNVFTVHNKPRNSGTVRTQYAIAPDEILLLFVGSGFKRKGLKHVINALPFVEGYKKIKLLIVGKGNTGEYQRLARQKGIFDRVIFAGTCRNIQEIYTASDIFIFPSEYDPFGIACLEAMASGLPVIASKSSGISEIITQGKDGFLVNYPIDEKEIASYIHFLLDKNTREQIGWAARRTSEMYSFVNNTEKILRIYQKVLNKRCNKNVY